MTKQQYITLILNNLTNFGPIMDKYHDDPVFQEALAAVKGHYPDVIEGLVATWEATQAYKNGEIGANDVLGVIGQYGDSTYISPETEKWLDNEIARENTEQQQNYEISARDTSLLSAGNQLIQLGLSPSGVVQTGGASAGVSGSTAATAMRSNSALRQQAKINKYNQQMGLAKSLIGAASSMASSGIYGAALGAVKHSARAISATAAHSGLSALKATQMIHSNKNWEQDWAKFVHDLDHNNF